MPQRFARYRRDGPSASKRRTELRAAFRGPIPAFLVTGDISPALLQEAQHGAYHLLHKPVDPMPLRTMLNRLLKKRDAVGGG